MRYTEVSLNARKQILQSIGWVMFIFCIGKTYLNAEDNKANFYDVFWILFAVLYIFRGLKLTNDKVIKLKFVNLNHPPTRVMFVIYGLLMAVIISFGIIYNLYYNEMMITSPYDY